MKRMQLFSLLIGAVGAIGGAFLLGLSIGQRASLRQASIEYNSVQAMLAFNRMQDERDWLHLLSKGCIPQVKEELDAHQDEDEELLADFFKGGLDKGVTDYIAGRDPGLIRKLPRFKSRYEKGWSEAAC